MKPSPELIEAARQAFYNNQGNDADCPFELMFETLEERGLIRLPSPERPSHADPDLCEER